MKLSKSEISFFQSKNIFIESSALTLINTNKTYVFEEIKHLELKVQRFNEDFKPSLFQRLFFFAKYFSYKYHLKNFTVVKKKVTIYLILKNNYKLVVYSSFNFDIITATKLIDKLNFEIKSMN